jgi:hypothetical protein
MGVNNCYYFSERADASFFPHRDETCAAMPMPYQSLQNFNHITLEAKLKITNPQITIKQYRRIYEIL